ncbi:hypothetical protein NKH75_27270 [Mesorhizobium sp. M0984]|uniref:hypothetical protein n=1 Tax=Mesorhizobium sp. M0984 TaxID=2957041 RepID=UPI003339DD2F
MPNNTVRAAAEGMPDVNRRRLLLGLAAASTAAAGLTVAPPAHSAAQAENPDLIRLGDALPLVEAEYVKAHKAERAVLAEWSPRWPLAPACLIDGGDEVDRKLSGWAFEATNCYGEVRSQKIASVLSLGFGIELARHVLKGKAIDKRKIRGLDRRGWEGSLAQSLRLRKTAETLEAKRARIKKASGLASAKAQTKAAFDRFAETVKETMGHECATMDGVVIKALALDAWSRHADRYDVFLTQGASTWGQQLAASVLRLAGEA